MTATMYRSQLGIETQRRTRRRPVCAVLWGHAKSLHSSAPLEPLSGVRSTNGGPVQRLFAVAADARSSSHDSRNYVEIDTDRPRQNPHHTGVGDDLTA
jgi:hypothetical protein